MNNLVLDSRLAATNVLAPVSPTSLFFLSLKKAHELHQQELKCTLPTNATRGIDITSQATLKLGYICGSIKERFPPGGKKKEKDKILKISSALHC